jgi:hypothetical protein
MAAGAAIQVETRAKAHPHFAGDRPLNRVDFLKSVSRSSKELLLIGADTDQRAPGDPPCRPRSTGFDQGRTCKAGLPVLTLFAAVVPWKPRNSDVMTAMVATSPSREKQNCFVFGSLDDAGNCSSLRPKIDPKCHRLINA